MSWCFNTQNTPILTALKGGSWNFKKSNISFYFRIFERRDCFVSALETQIGNPWKCSILCTGFTSGTRNSRWPYKVNRAFEVQDVTKLRPKYTDEQLVLVEHNLNGEKQQTLQNDFLSSNGNRDLNRKFVGTKGDYQRENVFL